MARARVAPAGAYRMAAPEKIEASASRSRIPSYRVPTALWRVHARIGPCSRINASSAGNATAQRAMADMASACVRGPASRLRKDSMAWARQARPEVAACPGGSSSMYCAPDAVAAADDASERPTLPSGRMTGTGSALGEARYRVPGSVQSAPGFDSSVLRMKAANSLELAAIGLIGIKAPVPMCTTATSFASAPEGQEGTSTQGSARSAPCSLPPRLASAPGVDASSVVLGESLSPSFATPMLLSWFELRFWCYRSRASRASLAGKCDGRSTDNAFAASSTPPEPQPTTAPTPTWRATLTAS